jgi:hypothetical protein
MDFLIYTTDSQKLKAFCRAQNAQEASDWASEALDIPPECLELLPARNMNVLSIAREQNIPLINYR